MQRPTSLTSSFAKIASYLENAAELEDEKRLTKQCCPKFMAGTKSKPEIVRYADTAKGVHNGGQFTKVNL